MASWQRKGVSDEQWELLLEQERLKGLVADELARAIRQAGLSKTEFAGRLGVSQARVSQILSGVGNLTLESLAMVSRPLGLRWGIRLSMSGPGLSRSSPPPPKAPEARLQEPSEECGESR